jgi:hypothetical protein
MDVTTDIIIEIGKDYFAMNVCIKNKFFKEISGFKLMVSFIKICLKY